MSNLEKEVCDIADVYDKEVNSFVVIQGVIIMLGHSRWCSTWTGGVVRRQELEIVDSSWPLPLQVTIWGARIDNVKLHSAVQVEGKVSSWRGRSLNARISPSLIFGEKKT